MSEKMYQISLTVPLGTRDGKLYLREEKGNVEGWLEVMNHRNYLTGTLSKDGAMVLYGKLKTVVDTISYTARGKLCGRKIFLNLKTESGVYAITGEEGAQYEGIL